jgi:polyvinyl alcohol dehydrogenase (cytochrome)
VWFSPVPRGACAGRSGCFLGYSAPATAIPGAVIAGALDGRLRALSAADGAVLWEFDTAADLPTVNGVAGRGGSIDVAGPVVAGGMVFAVSGYSTFGQMPGNLLLAFSR